MPNEIKLDPIQIAERGFALEYIQDYSVAAAARRCGISYSKAQRYMRNPNVLRQIMDIQEENAKYNLITEDFVKTQYRILFDRLMGETEVWVYNDKHGTNEQVKKFHASESVSLFKEMCRMTKVFEGGSDPVGTSIKSMADMFKQHAKGE